MAGPAAARHSGDAGSDAPLLVGPPRPRVRVAVGAVVVILLAGLAGAVVSGIAAPRGGSVTVAAATADPADEVLTVVVHVLGAVAAPGLYRLREGARVVDAVAAAGGFRADAERSGLNLARVLADAEQLVVPVVGAVPPAGSAAAGVAADGRVDLNAADRATLETLPRVGPAMAERIIAWRDANGGFRAVEDLLQVSGIGERTFDALRELVTV